MALKIIDLDIDESLSATTRVEEVGFVLQPAIETELIYFTSQEFEDTISDYPQYITDNALRAKRWVEQNGYGSCMTPVGKARLNQLANREPISILTIKRMKAYADRHKKDLEVSKSFDDGCGYLAWYSWGLDETGRVETWLEGIINRTEEEMEYEPSLPPYVNYADKEDDMLIKPILFVERNPGESKDEYVGRCTAYLIKNEGKDKDQAYAICISEAESFDCGCGGEFVEEYKVNEKYNLVGFIDGEPLFSTPVEAENYGKVTHGCGGYHTHYDEDGNEGYMACEVHPLEEDFSFGIEEYSEEEIETAKMLKFLAETDREQFEAVIGAMRGATDAEIKRRNHKNPTTYFRYDRVLAGSPDREFCTSIEGRYFRRLEIDLLKDINRDFGHNKMAYSKWLYKGGPNCVHAWRRYLVQEQNVVDDGFVEGKPGIPPKSMENNGYYSPETKRKSEVAYIVSQQNMSRQDFKADKDKRMLYSPLMLPNILIPRMENNQKYYVRFTPETIEKIQRKFMVEQRLRSNNYEHSDQKFNDVVMVESWIIAGDSDKAYELGFTKKNAPVGSWMGGYKVLDTPEGDIIWNDYIKSGKVKGLSVEGEFLLRTTNDVFFNKYDEAFDKIVEILQQVK